MIHIQIFLKDGLFYGMKSQGHASLESGTRGNNLVCAGVSTLVQTLFLYLRKHKLVEKFAQEAGFFYFELVDIRNPKMAVLVDNAYKMVIMGLEEIINQNPEELKLDFLEQSFIKTQRVS